MKINNLIDRISSSRNSAVLFAFASVLFAVSVSSTAGASGVQQVSTGAETACAISNGKAQCWGANGSGQIGNNTKKDSLKPADVFTAAPSDLGSKYVDKISVGKTHTCALANAKAYCWGDNSHGQLGNNSKTDSSVPIAVASNKNVIPKVPSKCLREVKVLGVGGCVQWSAVVPEVPASALGSKEIVDIVAGEYFTCALASDGTVACWGEGDLGRLGTNAETDVNHPVAVYGMSNALQVCTTTTTPKPAICSSAEATSPLFNKRGIKLSKASGPTMCVLAVDKSNSDVGATGQPYCWGYGIDNGTAIPTDKTGSVACNKNAPGAVPSTETNSFTFHSLKPVTIPGDALASADGSDYITGLTAAGRAYYWGMYGFKETITFSEPKSCWVNTCLSEAGNRIRLAVSVPNKAGTNLKNKAAANARANNGISKSPATVGYNGLGYTNVSTSYSASVTTQSSNGYSLNGSTSVTASAAHISTVANSNSGGGSSCGIKKKYGFKTTYDYEQAGQKVETTPPAWSGMQSGFKVASGNVYNGLYCATTNGQDPKCDTHGKSALEGQTGSGYVKTCDKKKVCTPEPIGPQSLVATGWLAGKEVTELSTNASGYTCAVANGALGCWGLNNKGQLGDGSKTNRNVPTGVFGLQ